jgi:CheY-like chemotaxis protein
VNTDLKVAEILLVEDDPGDVLITQEALALSRIANNLHHVSDGDEALAFLHRVGEHADAVRPDLILLDLNLPGRNGREVLAEVKASPDLRQIPVVVLTTSRAQEDVLESYDLHANAYVSKPVDFEEFTSVVGKIDDFFFAVAQLPPPA